MSDEAEQNWEPLLTAEEFEEFSTHAVRRLTGQLYVMLGDLPEAQDVVQEAFVRGWSRRRTLDKDGNPEGWIRTVAWGGARDGPGAGRRHRDARRAFPAAVALRGVPGRRVHRGAVPRARAPLPAGGQTRRVAAALAAAATAVRISGLFLAAALVVQLLTSAAPREEPHEGPRDRLPHRLRLLPWPLLATLPALGYAWYLHARTGDWMAWKHAEERGWYRTFHWPWQPWHTTWQAAFGHAQTTTFALLFQAELLAMVVGVALLALLALLLRRRRWAEAAYIGLSLWALGTSYWYMSVPRATLLWWPLWTGPARWSVRRPWLTRAYICLAAPLMTILTVAFTSGRWSG